MNNNIKVIVFDLGGVIIDLDKQACIEALEKLGFTDVSDYLGLYSQTGAFLELEEGKITEGQFYDFVREHTNPEVTDSEICTAFCAFLKSLSQYKLELLRTLRTEYKVCMLSNTNPVMYHSEIKRLFSQEGKTTEAYFDEFFLSYKMGITKPNRKIYENIIATLQVKPEEILFLDDSAKNCEAAAELGIQTYTVKVGEDLRPIFA